jgi:hypothetical protein
VNYQVVRHDTSIKLNIDVQTIGRYLANRDVSKPSPGRSNTMKMEADQKIADEALATLQRLRTSPDTKSVAQEIGTLASKMANKRVDEHRRADAWLAVCHLRDALDGTTKGANIAALWQDAIAETEAWCNE